MQYAKSMTGRASFLAAGALSLVGAFATEAPADERVEVPIDGQAPQAPPGGSSPEARGDPSRGAATPATTEHRTWYGGGIVAIDVLALTLPFVGLSSSSGGLETGLLGASAMGYVFGGPIVHAANGASGGVVGGSFALRLGLPLVGVLLGVAAGGPADASCEARGEQLCGFATVAYGAIGMAVGMVAASVIDVAALAWKTDGAPAPAAASRPSSLRLAPIFGVNREDRRVVPTFGVAGAF